VDLTGVAFLHARFDADARLLVLELDHGKANEMGTAALDAFAALCDLVERESAIACVCTTSRRTSKNGKPIFISGADVTERVGWDDDRVRAHVVRQRELMRRVRHLPAFHVVLTHGVTFGWGVEYLLTADYALATPTASFALPETGLGIVPGARGTAELADAVGPAQALRLGCTGETIAADEARRIGLVAELVDDVDAGLARARALSTLLARRSPTAVAAFKAALLAGRGEGEATRLELERRAYEHVVATGDAAIGRAAFADVRSGTVPAWPPRRPWRAP
jgi:enoyl-CoA hydratase/carnithine racemase